MKAALHIVRFSFFYSPRRDCRCWVCVFHLLEASSLEEILSSTVGLVLVLVGDTVEGEFSLDNLLDIDKKGL